MCVAERRSAPSRIRVELRLLQMFVEQNKWRALRWWSAAVRWCPLMSSTPGTRPFASHRKHHHDMVDHRSRHVLPNFYAFHISVQWWSFSSFVVYDSKRSLRFSIVRPLFYCFFFPGTVRRVYQSITNAPWMTKTLTFNSQMVTTLDSCCSAFSSFPFSSLLFPLLSFPFLPTLSLVPLALPVVALIKKLVCFLARTHINDCQMSRRTNAAVVWKRARRARPSDLLFDSFATFTLLFSPRKSRSRLPFVLRLV